MEDTLHLVNKIILIFTLIKLIFYKGGEDNSLRLWDVKNIQFL